MKRMINIAIDRYPDVIVLTLSAAAFIVSTTAIVLAVVTD